MRTDPGFRELRTERLLLRRSLPGDAEAISAYRSDPTVHEHQGWSRTDPDYVRAEIEEMLRRAPGEAGWVQFTVETLEGGRLVGDVGLSPRADEPGVVMLGYTIDPSEQRKGYATEAMGAVATYALDVLGATSCVPTPTRATSRRSASRKKSDSRSSSASKGPTRGRPGTECGWSGGGRTDRRPPGRSDPSFLLPFG